MVWVVGLGFFACFGFFFPPSRCHRDCGVLPPPPLPAPGWDTSSPPPTRELCGALRRYGGWRGGECRRGRARRARVWGGEGRGGGRAGTWGWPGREGSAAGGGRARPVSAAAAAGTASAVPAWQVRLEGSPEGGVRGGGVRAPERGPVPAAAGPGAGLRAPPTRPGGPAKP